MGRVLVAGASGNFGAAAVAAFGAAGWDVRRFRRGEDMGQAAQGCDVIVNGLNPPLYHDWARQIPQITAQVLAAAKTSGATVIVPGNVYVYGLQPGPWGPQTPHSPCSRKGAIRAAMEASYRESTARVILLRGGDFLDAQSPGTFLNMVTLKHLAKGRLTLAGAPDVRRAYAWLPDMARAAVALAAQRENLPPFADLPFAGLTFSMDDLKSEIMRQTGKAMRYERFPWALMWLASPFWELARELREMRYLFDLPHGLDPAPLAALLPKFQTTPFEQVVAAHLSAQAL